MRVAFVHYSYYFGEDLEPVAEQVRGRGHQAEVFLPGENVLHKDAIETRDIRMALESYDPDIILCVGPAEDDEILDLADLGKPMSRFFLKDGMPNTAALFDHNFNENPQFVDELEVLYYIGFGRKA